MDKIRAAGAIAIATARTEAAKWSYGKVTRGINDRDIAAHYQSFLRNFSIELSDDDAGRRQRAAAAALYQAGLYRHKLLFLRDLMTRFAAMGGHADPQPAFFQYCSSLIGDEEDLLKAERYYDLALQLAPDFAEVLYAYALLKQRKGMTMEAITFFEAAAKAPPHPNAVPYAHIAANAWRNLAEIHRDLENNEVAEACYHKALACHGIHGVHHAEITNFLQARGLIAEAMQEYERLMPYSHLYPCEFTEPDYPPEDRLPFSPNGNPCDPLKPTVVGEVIDGLRLVYWWHLYLWVPQGAEFDAPLLLKMKPAVCPAADAYAALTSYRAKSSGSGSALLKRH
jgi:tetratricopeptide (TPR) repeat protein